MSAAVVPQRIAMMIAMIFSVFVGPLSAGWGSGVVAVAMGGGPSFWSLTAPGGGGQAARRAACFEDTACGSFTPYQDRY
ncbi:hypothetical protein [Streptomyces sp. NPDC060333]|uniref:hypothetical protein n=1 Tax=Streptomyces sp. NPDC060333 TaxID=3347098 RepID=UPI003648A355